MMGMANQLKMAAVHAILTLHGLGWSQRQIAEKLGIHRETVARYVHPPPLQILWPSSRSHAAIPYMPKSPIQ